MTDKQEHKGDTQVFLMISGAWAALVAAPFLGVPWQYSVSACVGAGFTLMIEDANYSFWQKRRMKKLTDAGWKAYSAMEKAANLAAEQSVRVEKLEKAFAALRDITAPLPGETFAAIHELAIVALEDKAP